MTDRHAPTAAPTAPTEPSSTEDEASCPFTLFDGLALIAATTPALALLRWTWSDLPWRIWSVGRVEQLPIVASVALMLAAPFALGWGLTLVWLRLRRPG